MLEWLEDMYETPVRDYPTLTDGVIMALKFFYENGLFNDNSRTGYPTNAVLGCHDEF